MTDLVDITLSEWRQTRFAYGQTDCLLSVGAYLAALGHPPAHREFIGRCTTQEQAHALMRAHGGPQALLSRFGLPHISPSAAQRGDVVLLDTGCGDMIAGLCTGGGVAARTGRGVVELQRRFFKIPYAWRAQNVIGR